MLLAKVSEYHVEDVCFRARAKISFLHVTSEQFAVENNND